MARQPSAHRTQPSGRSGTVAGVRQKNSAEMERTKREHKHGTEGSDSREFVRCNILLTLLRDNNVVTFVQLRVSGYKLKSIEQILLWLCRMFLAYHGRRHKEGVGGYIAPCCLAPCRLQHIDLSLIRIGSEM